MRRMTDERPDYIVREHGDLIPAIDNEPPEPRAARGHRNMIAAMHYDVCSVDSCQLNQVQIASRSGHPTVIPRSRIQLAAASKRRTSAGQLIAVPRNARRYIAQRRIAIASSSRASAAE